MPAAPQPEGTYLRSSRRRRPASFVATGARCREPRPGSSLRVARMLSQGTLVFAVRLVSAARLALWVRRAFAPRLLFAGSQAMPAMPAMPGVCLDRRRFGETQVNLQTLAFAASLALSGSMAFAEADKGALTMARPGAGEPWANQAG